MNFSGNPIDFLAAFLGGALVSFTPCIYPLIPITVGYIGTNSSGSKLKGLFLSLMYVTGVAITYAFLGILAVSTGTIFGRFTTLPLVQAIVGIVIVLFGLSMWDLFDIPLLNFVKLPAHRKNSYFSAFFLGLSSGLVISPCLTPVLGAILSYLTTQKNLLYGGLLLLSFAYGMGAVLILVGTFSAILPKPGKWSLYIKKAGGVVLIIMGLYLIINAIA